MACTASEGSACLDRFQRIQHLRGCITAIVTPMKPCQATHIAIRDEACAAQPAIDFQALERLIKFQLRNGVQGIAVMGTTGENPTVTDDEYRSVIETTLRVVRELNDKVPVIAGTGTNCTRTTIERTKTAESLGVDAAMIVTPFYNKPTEEGLFLHYWAVASACPKMPLIVYNVPARTGCDIKPNLVARLAKEIPSVVALKEAGGLAERYQELNKHCPPNFKIFSGDDGLAIESVAAGANVTGIISVSANVVPAAIQQAVELALQNNMAKAKELDDILQPLHSAIFIESNPIAVKHILATEMKLIPGGLRLPLTGLSENCLQVVHDVFCTVSQELQQAGAASTISTEDMSV